MREDRESPPLTAGSVTQRDAGQRLEDETATRRAAAEQTCEETKRSGLEGDSSHLCFCQGSAGAAPAATSKLTLQRSWIPEIFNPRSILKSSMLEFESGLPQCRYGRFD